jgi:hypothetical protein
MAGEGRGFIRQQGFRKLEFIMLPVKDDGHSLVNGLYRFFCFFGYDSET